MLDDRLGHDQVGDTLRVHGDPERGLAARWGRLSWLRRDECPAHLGKPFCHVDPPRMARTPRSVAPRRCTPGPRSTDRARDVTGRVGPPTHPETARASPAHTCHSTTPAGDPARGP